MQTKTPVIKHIEEVPVGSLCYYPTLGDGLLCISAKFDGQQDRSTVIIPLSGKVENGYALRTLRVDDLCGRVVLVEGTRAEADLSTATTFDEAVAHVGKDGTYIRLRSDRPEMRSRQCLRLEDGVIRSSPPSDSVGFMRWKIVFEDDPGEEVWSSDLLNTD